ncbi:hypothetical protein [uncultured Corynebacterium sp.]|uniref:hypothetical protein n=1 Tax=uncultured Corynebacterium sp. TaxID=159447 RepID=UPI0025F6573D|nr:hypothetical protein [uncultured Corynebacterium sp.]
MNTLRIERHDRLGTPTDPAPAAIDAARVWELADEAVLGHPDFAYLAGELAAYATEDAADSSVFLMAYDGGRCIGFLRSDAPRHDNVHHIHVEFRVLPGVDPAAVLDAAWPRFLDYCREENRTSITFWEQSRQDRPTIAAASGDGAVESTPVTDWLADRGFVLDQVEIAGTLDVAVAATEVEQAGEAGGVVKQGRYLLRTWAGPTPPELIDGMARLRARMMIEAPHGNRPVEEEKWDDDRIRREEVETVAAGRIGLWAVAVDGAGEPVAYTYLECPGGRPEVAFQMDTFVRRADRGHGLGMAVKAANLRQLRASRPDVARLHTWNARENQWMLAINRALGFAPTSALGAWEATAAVT